MKNDADLRDRRVVGVGDGSLFATSDYGAHQERSGRQAILVVGGSLLRRTDRWVLDHTIFLIRGTRGKQFRSARGRPGTCAAAMRHQKKESGGIGPDSLRKSKFSSHHQRA
jgi:hypothetical protein